MYALSPPRERRLIWLLALVQFTIIMDFMVMMPLGPQIMSAFHVDYALLSSVIAALVLLIPFLGPVVAVVLPVTS